MFIYLGEMGAINEYGSSHVLPWTLGVGLTRVLRPWGIHSPFRFVLTRRRFVNLSLKGNTDTKLQINMYINTPPLKIN